MLRSLITGLLFCLVWSGTTMVHADEFTTVPQGDPIYSQLASVNKAGWIGEAPGAENNHALTRYEVALETAKAIFTVIARHRADIGWAATAPKASLRALRDLTVALRPELKQLEIDANATRALLDGLIKAPLNGANVVINPALSNNHNVRPNNGGLLMTAPHSDQGITPLAHPRTSALTNLVSGGLTTTEQTMSLPLSQRLRVNTALESLAREEDDPLRNSPLTVHRSAFEMTHSSSANSLTARTLGTSLDVNHWLTFNANYRQQSLVPRPYSLREALFTSSTQSQSLGGGVDIRLLHSLTLSGNMAKVVGTGDSTVRGTRFGGGLGLSGWQNRLSLNANLSRLVPEDSLALSSTAADLNIGLDVTQRLSLNLLYQQMFGIQNQTQVAGGIVINF